MDNAGRRSSKTVGGQTTTYIYDGQNLIAERGASVAEFLFGPGIDEPLAMYRSGSAYYYDVDGLGSVTLMNDINATVQDKYLYDGWGITRSSTTPISNPFVYTARESGEAGFLFYRARYYNPNSGRFISEDPIGAIMLRYRYTGNNPINRKDPLGLWFWQCTYTVQSFGGPEAGMLGTFSCDSDCQEGTWGIHVELYVEGGGVDVGSLYGYSTGKVQLEDPYSWANPNALDGLFSWIGGGLVLPIEIKTSIAYVQLGDASGITIGGKGGDLSIGTFIGKSFLRGDWYWKKCCPRD